MADDSVKERGGYKFKLADDSVKERGGYKFKFVITPPGTLLCQICQFVARDPQLSVCCGNNFCKSCLGRFGTGEGCPACDDGDCFFTTFPNKLSEREIMKLLVWCPNNEKGCGWRDELAKVGDHMASCEFESTECSNRCGVMIERQKTDEHLSSECPYRQAKCEYCNLIGVHHVIMGQHREECTERPMSCPNECGLGDMKRNELEEHLRSCPLQELPCTYHDIGCEAKILIMTGGQDEHDEACMKEHFQLMRNELAQTKEDLLELKLQVGEGEVKRKLLPAKGRLFQEESETALFPEMKDGDCDTPAELEMVNRELSKTQQEFAQWKKQTNFLLHQILGTMEWSTRLQVLSTLTDNTDLQLTTPVIIKVDDVALRKEYERIHKSPAFLTRQNGHMVCLHVLPGGAGTAVTNFSVHIKNLSKGNRELRGNFVVSLMNQLGDSNHCSTKVKYVSGQEVESSVNGNVSMDCEYVIDDCVYFEVCYSSLDDDD